MAPSEEVTEDVCCAAVVPPLAVDAAVLISSELLGPHCCSIHLPPLYFSREICGGGGVCEGRGGNAWDLLE